MTYGKRFEEALIHAAGLHRDQTRKGTYIPYVTHLLAVAAIVGENGGTEDEVVAALLHDARSILADLRTEGEALWDRFAGAKAGTLWYYRALVETYGASGPTLIVEELDRVVREIEDLAGRRSA